LTLRALDDQASTGGCLGRSRLSAGVAEASEVCRLFGSLNGDLAANFPAPRDGGNNSQM
jgi:hypothetical protein